MQSIKVYVLGDESGFTRSIKKAGHQSAVFSAEVTGHMHRVRSAVRSVSASLLGGAGLLYALHETLGAADDLDTSIRLTQSTFGASESGVKSWSKTTALGLGIARDESLKYANTFGQLLEHLNQTPAVAARGAKALVGLASDVAKTTPGAAVEDVVHAEANALTGRGLALKRFGIVITAEKVKEEAYRLGIAKTGSALSDSQKVFSVYRLLLGQVASRHAQAARQGDNYHTTQMKLNAEFRDSEALIGNALIPTAEKYGSELVNWLSKSKNQAEITREVETVVKDVTQAIKGAVDVIVPLAKGINSVVQLAGGWKTAFELITGGFLIHKFFALSDMVRGLIGRFRVLGPAAQEAAGQQIAAEGEVASATQAAAATQVAAEGEVAAATEATTGVFQAQAAAVVSSGRVILGVLSKIALGFAIVHEGVGLITGDQNMGWDFSDPVSKGDSHSRAGLSTSVSALLGDRSTPETRKLGKAGTGKTLQQLRDSGVSDAAFRAALNHPLSGQEVSKAQANALEAAYRHTKASRGSLKNLKGLLGSGNWNTPGIAGAGGGGRTKSGVDPQLAAQMRLLGLDSSGGALPPGIKALRAELGNVQGAVKGTFLDTKEHEKLFANIRKLLSGQLGALGSEMRGKIKDLLDGLKSQMSSFDGFDLTEADRRRRQLDRAQSQHYGRGERHYHYSPHVVAVQNEPVDRAMRRGYFDMRTRLGMA